MRDTSAQRKSSITEETLEEVEIVREGGREITALQLISTSTEIPSITTTTPSAATVVGSSIQASPSDVLQHSLSSSSRSHLSTPTTATMDVGMISILAHAHAHAQAAAYADASAMAFNLSRNHMSASMNIKMKMNKQEEEQQSYGDEMGRQQMVENGDAEEEKTREMELENEEQFHETRMEQVHLHEPDAQEVERMVSVPVPALNNCNQLPQPFIAHVYAQALGRAHAQAQAQAQAVLLSYMSAPQLLAEAEADERR